MLVARFLRSAGVAAEAACAAAISDAVNTSAVTLRNKLAGMTLYPQVYDAGAFINDSGRCMATTPASRRPHLRLWRTNARD